MGTAGLSLGFFFLCLSSHFFARKALYMNTNIVGYSAQVFSLRSLGAFFFFDS